MGLFSKLFELHVDRRAGVSCQKIENPAKRNALAEIVGRSNASPYDYPHTFYDLSNLIDNSPDDRIVICAFNTVLDPLRQPSNTNRPPLILKQGVVLKAMEHLSEMHDHENAEYAALAMLQILKNEKDAFELWKDRSQCAIIDAQTHEVGVIKLAHRFNAPLSSLLLGAVFEMYPSAVISDVAKRTFNASHDL